MIVDKTGLQDVILDFGKYWSMFLPFSDML